jgi:hypothetical protein
MRGHRDHQHQSYGHRQTKAETIGPAAPQNKQNTPVVMPFDLDDESNWDFGAYICVIDAGEPFEVDEFERDTPPVPHVKIVDTRPPATMDAAINGEFGLYWRAAIQKEVDTLLDCNVFRCERLPRGAKPIPGKFVLKMKPDKDGFISKFKARWVCQGFRQKYGVDYTSTYAAVCSAVAIRLVISIANENRWSLENMDVSAAYLQASLKESTRMYVAPPPGFCLPPGYGLRLLKALYGTRQGGNRWATHRDAKLALLGMTRSDADPCLYFRSNADGYVLAAVIVDDFVITGSTPVAVARFKRELNETWKMTDLGPLRWCLNLSVERNICDGELTIKQDNYVDGILKKYGFTDVFPCDTPAVPRKKLEKVEIPLTERIEPDFYGHINGSFQHLRLTRPDLCTAISRLCQHNGPGRHNKSHADAQTRVMSYLKRTANFGLFYKSTNRVPGDPWRLEMYVDSDFANDRVRRHSRAGWLIYLNGDLVGFGSRLQTSPAQSSTEAEYMALSMAMRELLWIRNILVSVGITLKQPIVVFEDNQPAIDLSENAMASKRSRSIDTKHHWIRHYVNNGTIKLSYIHTKRQRADGMTKVLPRGPFTEFRDYCVSDRRVNPTRG